MTKDRFLDFCQLRWPVVRTDHIWCTDRCGLSRLNILVFSNQSRSQSSWALSAMTSLRENAPRTNRARFQASSAHSDTRTDLGTRLFLSVTQEHHSTCETCHPSTSLNDVPNTCSSNTSPCLLSIEHAPILNTVDHWRNKLPACSRMRARIDNSHRYPRSKCRKCGAVRRTSVDSKNFEKN